MQLDLEKLVSSYGLKPGAVVHAGASTCQEAKYYSSANFSPDFWVEALDDIANIARATISEFLEQIVLTATLWNEPGKKISFDRATNGGESSSAFRMKFHKSYFPSIYESFSEIHETTTLDSLDQNYNFGPVALLVLDLQGAELEALRGALSLISSVKCIFTEVSSIPMYAGQTTFNEFDSFMLQNGFHLMDHDLRDNKVMGDAIYLSSKMIQENLLVPVTFPDNLPKISIKCQIFYFLRILRFPTSLLTLRSRI